ncbi:MAG: hypothetical protein L0H79_21665 [Intrasporangium sp.]|uniref:hypothetical protein n=1 Tax=Intrasporangium sp. TaxID=1925024 RepID=UPI002647461F|nr:hypothetical protein [Intrasporangium sp.]MDN5798335.1 hypothetical protein [Intrasporangium sp.]
MNTNSRPSVVGSSLRRGLGIAGAAVAVAFVGAAGLGAADAQAAGVSAGVAYLSHATPPEPMPATNPANLPPASTLAVRYSFEDGDLRQL